MAQEQISRRTRGHTHNEREREGEGNDEREKEKARGHTNLIEAIKVYTFRTVRNEESNRTESMERQNKNRIRTERNTQYDIL